MDSSSPTDQILTKHVENGHLVAERRGEELASVLAASGVDPKQKAFRVHVIRQGLHAVGESNGVGDLAGFGVLPAVITSNLFKIDPYMPELDGPPMMY